MPGFLSNLLRLLRERRGTDMDFLCHHLLSERGEASQTVLAQEIIKAYRVMNAGERRKFFEMLCRKFGPDETAVLGAAAAYKRTPDAANLAALSAAVEPPRQELLRRINTATRGTETLVALRGHLLELATAGTDFQRLAGLAPPSGSGSQMLCVFPSGADRRADHLCGSGLVEGADR